MRTQAVSSPISIATIRDKLLSEVHCCYCFEPFANLLNFSSDAIAEILIDMYKTCTKCQFQRWIQKRSQDLVGEEGRKRGWLQYFFFRFFCKFEYFSYEGRMEIRDGISPWLRASLEKMAVKRCLSICSTGDCIALPKRKTIKQVILIILFTFQGDKNLSTKLLLLVELNCSKFLLNRKYQFSVIKNFIVSCSSY